MSQEECYGVFSDDEEDVPEEASAFPLSDEEYTPLAVKFFFLSSIPLRSSSTVPVRLWNHFEVFSRRADSRELTAFTEQSVRGC